MIKEAMIYPHIHIINYQATAERIKKKAGVIQWHEKIAKPHQLSKKKEMQSSVYSMPPSV